VRPEVERDQRHSINAVADTWDQWLAPLTNCRDLRRGEGTDEPALQLLDQIGFMDYVAVGASGRPALIAMRVQFEPLIYPSHTIRYTRQTGTVTEFRKWRAALAEEDPLLPTWVIQVYVSRKGGRPYRFMQGAAVRGRPFGHYITSAGLPVQAAPDGNTFLIAWWEQMRKAGVEVQELHSAVRANSHVAAVQAVLAPHRERHGYRPGMIWNPYTSGYAWPAS
jgi:hypothetical protein